jgi:GntR family transcriptional regulator, rspAB operon transcriptional repressor
LAGAVKTISSVGDDTMTEGGFTAIKTARVTDTVYEVLRERIVERALVPGSKINVDDVAKQLGVSRTPVHEALSVLASDGLVEVQPRRGTFVTEFTQRDYAETLDIRRSLELLACETACAHATDEDIRELDLLAKRMQAAVDAARSPAEAARVHDGLNLEFHRRLVHMSANRRLIAMYEDLRAHLRIARAHVDATEWFARVPTETREHAEIVRALAQRDVDATRSALDRHLRRSAASLIADVRLSEGRKANRENRYDDRS